MTELPEQNLSDEDGYELWLRYKLIDDANLLEVYRAAIQRIVMKANSPTLQAAQEELQRGLRGLLGITIPLSTQFEMNGTLLCGTIEQLTEAVVVVFKDKIASLSNEGFLIASHQGNIVITAKTDMGVLYSVFHFLRHLQTHQPIENLHIVSMPKLKLRMLNHWDNLDRTIERGYAGFSLWDWHKLPYYIDPRYKDYARANASIGINATVLTNVNANALILTPQYLHKAAALAEVFRPYKIRVFLTARFSAPMEIGGLTTANPLDPDVAQWWQKTVETIYSIIPDFGGFVVKANSEGQPGPYDYGCSHADGANMLADALAPYNGIVIWRAFVYDPDVTEDRAKQANSQLAPLDGFFRDNVLLQVKNGAIDFQPREPYHPLFGAMPQTPLMLEVQITQEYLGCATHLVYLAPLFKETLNADTYCKGAGSTVAKIIDGSLDGHAVSGMAGVSNIGNERNWCGHPFAAANWYAFGRLTWDYDLSSEQIAREWLGMTFTNQPDFIQRATEIMLTSREAVVEYMMPLGLHHLFARNHHYGPGPWVDGGRADWTSVYYHQADAHGIGFDRTASGSNAISLYYSPYRDLLENRETCPENLLLWFHHVAWDYRMQSGRTLWGELCFIYNRGVQSVRQIQAAWDTLADKVDTARFTHVKNLLQVQEREACWWRDACLLYFQTFSGMPIPPEYEQPAASLAHYMNIRHYYVPGIHESYSPLVHR
jgi:alpha-glucuronidase